MSTYYDNWLGFYEKGVQERKNAKKVIYPEELNWVRTRQDAKSALLVAPENGFKTVGGVTMIGEIPPGWKTGKHSHGEEAMYILEGNGFSIIDDQKFTWETGTCIRVPFGAVHQHFNAGEKPAKYYSAVAPHFEYYCNVAKIEQFEDCGPYNEQPPFTKEGTDYSEPGVRLVLHQKDAYKPKRGEDHPHHQSAFTESHPEQMKKVHHSQIIRMMGINEEFRGEEVEITDVFVDRAHNATEKHAHMEAILYILQGEGYSIIDGEKIPWKQGTALHVQGPQTVHQHFVTSDVEGHELRTHFGIRKFVQPIAKKTFPYLFFEEGHAL
jgi:mannose-6-phosphate isomerase-like protein (cupin superfamily)